MPRQTKSGSPPAKKHAPQETAILKTGILNPAINSLLSRTRHTNTLVLADRGFPSWPGLEIIDISLIDGLPTVTDVLRALLPNYQVGRAFIAHEFTTHNPPQRLTDLKTLLADIPLTFEPHPDFKKRVPQATGLIRTGDTTAYANIILESA